MNKLVTLLLLIASVMMLVTPMPVSAASNVTKSKFQGDSAFASFSGVNPTDPCILTFASISATDGRVKEGPGKPEPISEAYVSIFRYSDCTGEVLLDAFGFIQLPPEAFAVQGQLDAATLTANVEVCDFVSGSCFPRDVQVAWSATGPLVREKSKFQSKSPSCHLLFDFIGNFRQATATGSIVGEDVTISGAADFAQLASVKSGTITIGCGA